MVNSILSCPTEVVATAPGEHRVYPLVFASLRKLRLGARVDL